MKKSKPILLNHNTAFVAFSSPGSRDFELHLCEHHFDNLTDENLDIYDFLCMPFISELKLNSFFKYKESYENIAFSFKSSYDKTFNTVSKESYLDDVNKLIKTIKSSELNKAIYSRVIDIDNPSMDLGTLFSNLCAKYINAFVFIYNIPNEGCWIGATPELLLSKNGDSLTTVALAGTQKFTGEVERTTWGQKEIDEQAYISDFVRKIFVNNNMSYTESSTTTKAAGSVCHIFTEFNSSLPESMAMLIQELHPGPAISGSPKKMAINTILQLEKQRRYYYTGFLGDISGDNMNLYINLRSMEVLESKFLLYVGGGITADSVAEDEWIETELKSDTMSSLIL